MHELGIAEAVLNALRVEAARYPNARPARAGLRIGQLAGVNAEALQFCFEAIARSTEFECFQLEIESCPRRQRCLECGGEFVVHDYELECPRCPSRRSECVGGDELELAFLEVEEYAASGAGPESTQ
jgi:hydrogenase nickel incorporation protein HypA/HybF